MVENMKRSIPKVGHLSQSEEFVFKVDLQNNRSKVFEVSFNLCLVEAASNS